MDDSASRGFTGQCQCGHIRFSFQCDPITVYTCHCTDCQQQSSAAFGISVWFPQAEFSLDQGNLSFWSTVSDAGNTKLCSFCDECGSRIYHALDHSDDVLSVKGGTLDRVGELVPAAHIWMRSALPWVQKRLRNDVCYDTEPGDFAEIVSLYQKDQQS